MSKSIKVGMVQHACTGDRNENLALAIEGIGQAAADGAQIICLQELFQSIYFCFEESPTYFDWAEKVPGEITERLSTLSRQLEVVIVASMFEKRAEGLYHNTAVVFDADGTVAGKYRKHHIPDDPGYYEKYYFTPGDGGYQVIHTKYANIGVLVCWDQWFPEAARLTALKGAEMLIYPTAIGWDIHEMSAIVNDEQRSAWQIIQQSHAIANGIPVVAVNRVGTENGQKFWGSSFVCNAFGRILHQCGTDTNEVVVVDLSLNESAHYRNTWPFLRDRRIDTYNDLNKRFID